MLKTHKPCGYIWSGSTQFQQLEGYRKICSEECSPPHTAVLIRDSDDDFEESQRGAKRRRIEGLAKDFFDGRLPFISSATRIGDYRKPSEKRAASILRLDIGTRERLITREPTWVEVDDDWKAVRNILARRGKPHASPTKPRNQISRTLTVQDSLEQGNAFAPSDKVPAVRSSVRTQATKELTAQTKDAAKRAATLKAHANRKPSARESGTTVVRGVDCDHVQTEAWRLKSEGVSVRVGSASSACRQGQHVLLSPSRATRRAYQPRTPKPTPSGIIDDTTIDPLQGISPGRRPWALEPGSLSPGGKPLRHTSNTLILEEQPSTSSHNPEMTRTNTPRPQGRRPSHLKADDSNITNFGYPHRIPEPRALIPDRHFAPMSIQDGSQRSSKNIETAESLSVVKASYHTAPEVTEAAATDACPDADPSLPPEMPFDEGDSQTALLLRNGVNASSRQSFAPVNTTPAIPVAPVRAASPRTQGCDVQNSIREAVQHSAQQYAGKRNSRRTSKRRKTDPNQSIAAQLDGQLGQGLAAGNPKQIYRKTQKDYEESPFLFRNKKALHVSHEDEASAMEVRTNDGLQSSFRFFEADPSRAPAGAAGKQPLVISKNAPSLDISPPQDSPVGINLNRAIVAEQNVAEQKLSLVEMHMNSILPSEHGSRRSSKTLEIRRAMRAAGADIEKAPGEPPSPHCSVDVEQPVHGNDLPPIYAPVAAATEFEGLGKPVAPIFQSQTHPSTQAMLSAAERGLIESPEKAAAGDIPVGTATPEQHEDSIQGITPFCELNLRMARQLLKQQPHETQRSTQAMLADFSGFSTVKKPGPRDKASFALSPTKGANGLDDQSLDANVFTSNFASEHSKPVDSLRTRGTNASDRRSSGIGRPQSSLRFTISQPDAPSKASPEAAVHSLSQPNTQRSITDNFHINPKQTSFVLLTPSMLAGSAINASQYASRMSLPSQRFSISPSFNQASAWASLPRDSQMPSILAAQQKFDDMCSALDRPSSSGTQRDMDDVARSLLGSQPWTVENEARNISAAAG